jgi:predicted lysophospholipase L1 biosynthesis ABC-type transport system permease subunit
MKAPEYLRNISAGSSFAPSVYIGKSFLEDTELLQPGSIANYAQYHKVSEDINLDEWKKEHRKLFRDASIAGNHGGRPKGKPGNRL